MLAATKNAILIFSDGTVFKGHGIGFVGKTFGEICFNTAITGYQEILTDPSYHGQIITFTFPHIGNVGINLSDIEAKEIKACGLIIRENITSPSNYRSVEDLNIWLRNNSIDALMLEKNKKLSN